MLRLLWLFLCHLVCDTILVQGNYFTCELHKPLMWVGSWFNSRSAPVYCLVTRCHLISVNTLLLGILLGFQTDSFNYCTHLLLTYVLNKCREHLSIDAIVIFLSATSFHHCQPISCDPKSQFMTISFPKSNAMLSFQLPNSNHPRSHLSNPWLSCFIHPDQIPTLWKQTMIYFIKH